MKWIILNETPGRIRARLVTARRYAEDGRASKMTAEEADLAEYALLAADGVESVKVFERTGDAVIRYSGKRDAVIRALQA